MILEAEELPMWRARIWSKSDKVLGSYGGL